MRELAGAVDVALLPVCTWGPHLGPGHLGPRSAAEAWPTSTRPSRSRSIGGRSIPGASTRSGAARSTEPGDRFAAHAARLAPAGDRSQVLRPGEATSIGSTG